MRDPEVEEMISQGKCPVDYGNCDYVVKHGFVDCVDCMGISRLQKYQPSKGFKKKPIPKSIRNAVLERDKYTCQICGSKEKLTIDHIIPEVKGGKATLENCRVLCKSCNSRKGAL